ncbi:MAG TPA: hypothetical protein VMR49_02625 [Candidatus Paceibacterota bacterium]|jgi:hypothetical protein|nr:hypothetical protein [Candidatus Paceibacterota bacterium]
MAINTEGIEEIFTDDQKKMIALYEKQIDDHIMKYYLEGKKLDVKPEPYPHSHYFKIGDKTTGAGCDERVVGEIIKKYSQAGWSIKWVFNETSAIDGDWVFRLKKINNFVGKSLKISFTYKDPKSGVTEHSLIIPILGVYNQDEVFVVENLKVEVI